MPSNDEKYARGQRRSKRQRGATKSERQTSQGRESGMFSLSLSDSTIASANLVIRKCASSCEIKNRRIARSFVSHTMTQKIYIQASIVGFACSQIRQRDRGSVALLTTLRLFCSKPPPPRLQHDIKATQ